LDKTDQLKDLKVVWLQQRIDSVRKAVNANTDNIRDLKDEIQAMRSRIVDFRVKFSEQQRQFQLRQVSRKKPDPRSFFESWKQRARPVAALIRSDRVPESQWCRQAAGFPPRAPREEWVLPLHAAAAAAEASRQQVVLQPESPPALPQLWFMPALDAQSFQESAKEVLVPSFAPASEAVFDSPLSLVQPPIEVSCTTLPGLSLTNNPQDCLMLDSLSGPVENLHTDPEAGSASASIDKDHRFAGTENLSDSLRRPTAQFFAPSPSFAFAPEASTRASATSVAPPPLAPTPAPALAFASALTVVASSLALAQVATTTAPAPAPALNVVPPPQAPASVPTLAFASAPTVVASSLAPTSTPAPAATESVLRSAFLPLRTLSNVVEPQNQVTVASPPPKTPSNAARQQGTPPAPLKTKDLVDHSIESKSEEAGKTLGPNSNGLFSGGNGGTTIATSFTFRSAVAAADVLTPAPLLPQTLSNVAGPQNTGTVAPSSLQTVSNATEQQGAPARTDRPMIAPRSRRSAKTSSSAGNAVAGPSGSAAKTAAPLAMSPSPAIGGSSSMGAQLADPAPAATTAPSSSAAGVPSDPKGKGKAKAPEAPVVDDQSPGSLPKWPMTGKAYRELMNEVIEAVKLKMMGGQVKKTMDTDIRPIQLLAINSEDKVNAEVKDILEKDYIPDSKACADKVARFFYSPNGELMRNVEHDLKRNRLPSYYEAIQFAVLSEIRKKLAGHGIELPQEVWVSGYKHKISGESLVDILEELIDKVSTRMESKNESTLLSKFKDNAKTDLVDQVDFSIMMEHDEAADWAAMFLYDRSGWLIENIETRLPGLYKSEMLQEEVLKMVRQIFAARDVFFPESVTIEGYL